MEILPTTNTRDWKMVPPHYHCLYDRFLVVHETRICFKSSHIGGVSVPQGDRWFRLFCPNVQPEHFLLLAECAVQTSSDGLVLELVYGPLYAEVAQGCLGAIDSKISSFKTRRSFRGLVISGPTNDQQPTFSWGQNANCPLDQMPEGSPVTFDFPWVSFVPSKL